MSGQGYKGSRPQKAVGEERIYRSEWRVISPTRLPRTEVFDVGFQKGQDVHLHLSKKLEFVLKQLQHSVLKFGEKAEFSRVYFVGTH